MDLEVLIWIVFIVGSVIYNLVQNRKKKARQRAEAASQARVDGGLAPAASERPVPHPKLPATYGDLAAHVPPVPPRRLPASKPPTEPSGWADTGWGRQAGKVADEVAEDVVEAVPASLPSEVPAPAARVAPTQTPRASLAPRPAPAMPVRRPRRFQTSTEVRSAIIGMTVLGPCRALAPYEEPDGAGPSMR